MAWRTTMPAAPSCLPSNFPAAITETGKNVSEGEHRESHSDLAPRTKTGEQSRQPQQQRMDTEREREREKQLEINQPRTKNRARTRTEIHPAQSRQIKPLPLNETRCVTEPHKYVQEQTRNPPASTPPRPRRTTPASDQSQQPHREEQEREREGDRGVGNRTGST
jgi:hypothetical protein